MIRMSYVALQRVFYILSPRNDSNSRVVVSSYAAAAAAFASLEPVYGVRGVTSSPTFDRAFHPSLSYFGKM